MSSDSAAPGAGERRSSGLLLDLYQLTMAQSYFAEGMHLRPATFALYTRTLPAGWGYLVAAGLEDALGYLERFAFSRDDLAYLERTRLFTADFLAYLAELRFSGDVRALPEGTVFFPNEPVLEVTAPVLEAQLVETVLLQEIQFQSLVAAKAARCVDVAGGRTLRRLRPAPHAPCRCGHAASPGRASWRASTRPATSSRGSSTGSRSPARWRTPTSRRSPTS